MAIKHLAAVLILMSSQVFAATGNSASAVAVEDKAESVNSQSIGQQLSDANNRILLLTAQLKAAELKAQIAEKNSELLKNGVSSEDPSVQSIEGLSSRLSATLALSNGKKMRVSEGDTLPNGMKVKSISDHEVILSKGKITKRLPVMANTGQPNGYSTQQPSPYGGPSPMPPMPIR